jgi:hypothetical protein
MFPAYSTYVQPNKTTYGYMVPPQQAAYEDGRGKETNSKKRAQMLYVSTSENAASTEAESFSRQVPSFTIPIFLSPSPSSSVSGADAYSPADLDASLYLAQQGAWYGPPVQGPNSLPTQSASVDHQYQEAWAPPAPHQAMPPHVYPPPPFASPAPAADLDTLVERWFRSLPLGPIGFDDVTNLGVPAPVPFPSYQV